MKEMNYIFQEEKIDAEAVLYEVKKKKKTYKIIFLRYGFDLGTSS